MSSGHLQPIEYEMVYSNRQCRRDHGQPVTIDNDQRQRCEYVEMHFNAPKLSLNHHRREEHQTHSE